MSEDDTLAGSRRAARVEETCWFILVHGGVVERCSCRGADERVVLAVVDADHAVDEPDEAARVTVGDQDACAGVGDRIFELGLRPAEVERHL
jgi:hypothetical protein